MPYAKNKGTRIRYEVTGAGEPLVLHGGLGEQVESWHAKGIVDLLSDRFRLVILDPRGQGESDKPHDPAAYTLEERVGDVIAVLDAERIRSAHFFGYSQGGRAGFGLAALAPGRVRSLVLGGAAPYYQDMSTYREILRGDMERALGLVEQAIRASLPGAAREMLLRNDIEALRAAYAEDRPDISREARRVEVPMLLFAGRDDPLCAEVRRFAEETPWARFVELPGMAYFTLGLQLAVVLPEVVAFLESLRAAPGSAAAGGGR